MAFANQVSTDHDNKHHVINDHGKRHHVTRATNFTRPPSHDIFMIFPDVTQHVILLAKGLATVLTREGT